MESLVLAVLSGYWSDWKTCQLLLQLLDEFALPLWLVRVRIPCPGKGCGLQLVECPETGDTLVLALSRSSPQFSDTVNVFSTRYVYSPLPQAVQIILRGDSECVFKGTISES